MEHEEKRCPVCNTAIRKDSKAIYCCQACSRAAYYRRHTKALRADGGMCYFNSEVLCTKKQCETCGWNPVVEKRRKEALA